MPPDEDPTQRSRTDARTVAPPTRSAAAVTVAPAVPECAADSRTRRLVFLVVPLPTVRFRQIAPQSVNSSKLWYPLSATTSWTSASGSTAVTSSWPSGASRPSSECPPARPAPCRHHRSRLQVHRLFHLVTETGPPVLQLRDPRPGRGDSSTPRCSSFSAWLAVEPDQFLPSRRLHSRRLRQSPHERLIVFARVPAHDAPLRLQVVASIPIVFPFTSPVPPTASGEHLSVKTSTAVRPRGRSNDSAAPPPGRIPERLANPIRRWLAPSSAPRSTPPAAAESTLWAAQPVRIKTRTKLLDKGVKPGFHQHLVQPLVDVPDFEAVSPSPPTSAVAVPLTVSFP